MDKDLSDSDCQSNQEVDSEQSLVNKFKRNVSEIISNTPLSKWFRKQNETPTSSVRRRQDDSDDEEDFHEFQPPTKRTKLPPSKETLSLNVSETLSPIASVNNVKKPLYKNFPEPIAGPSGYQTRKMLNSTSFTTESNYKSVKTVSETTENVFKNPRILTGISEGSSNVNKESQSDSEESTSGYSSGRIGSKEVVSQESSKQTSPLENSPKKARSLFQNSSTGHGPLSDRSISPNRNSSLSSRMPSFNPSTFGSSNFVDRTLSTKRILNSPFYNGNTIYGGASAYGRNSKRIPQDMRKVLRQSISIKPVNKGIEKGNMQLGKTARRILDTLEQYTSPISDVKKVPVASKRLKSDGALTKYIGANPYSTRGSRTASNKELQVPSVTDLLKMKIDQQKTRLQDSTEAVRQIATKSRSVLNEASYSIPVQRENDKRTTGKMKTKITSVRQKITVEETIPDVRLNPVSLPIKELPKFDIVVPPPSQKPLQTTSTTSTTSNMSFSQAKPSPPVSKPTEHIIPISKPVESNGNATKLKETVKVSNPSGDEDIMEFKFSAPLVLAEYFKPLKALNNFKFSEPLIKKRRSIHPELDDQENKLVDGKKSKKNNGENIVSPFGNSESSKDGSSVSLMDKFKRKEGTWECSVCMIRNSADCKKCAACETTRSLDKQGGNKTPVTVPSSLTGTSLKPLSSPLSLADKFKTPSNTWECPTCMIRNKEDVLKCAACETRKPDSGPSKAPSKDSLTNKVPATAVPPAFSFGDKFKASSDTWECSTCLIRNKNDVTKCAACETQKPGDSSSKGISSGTPTTGSGFGKQFAPPSSTWECSVCMIRNKDELTKCAACESAKPGAQNQRTFSPLGGQFSKKEDEWECEVCMVRNKSTTTKCQCCESLKPGSVSSDIAVPTLETSKISTFNFGIDKKTATSFSFGIPPNTQSNTPKTNAAQIFGENREKVDKKETTPTFSFGVPPSSTSGDSKGAEVKKDTPIFTFNTAKKDDTDSSKSVAPTKSEGEGATTKTTPTFNFGLPSKLGNTSQAMTTPTFTFSPANKVEEKVVVGVGLSENKEDKKINPFLKPDEKLHEKAAVASPGFSFGLPKGPVSTPTTGVKPSETSNSDESPSKRSRPASELPETPKIPMFTFKPPTTNGDVNKTAPFTRSSEEKKPAAPVGGFSFKTDPVKSTAPTSAIVTPTFGTTVPKANSSNSAPVFKFGASSFEGPKPANGFNFEMSAPTTTAFGIKDSTASKPFTFTSPAPSTSASPALSGMNPASAFGIAPTKTPMFQFGGTPENKPQTSTPAFNINPPTTENSTGFRFLFGANSTKIPTFALGPSPTPTPPDNAGFIAKPWPGPGENLFGASSSKPEAVFRSASSQNPTPNGMFNFGSGTTNNQKAGFSFGASSGSSDSTAAAPSQGGFNFGTSTANAPTASGGFNFSAAAPAFDANAKPSFNFTGGTAGITTFSAPPSQDGAVPQRKIKKAIRRTVR